MRQRRRGCLKFGCHHEPGIRTSETNERDVTWRVSRDPGFSAFCDRWMFRGALRAGEEAAVAAAVEEEWLKEAEWLPKESRYPTLEGILKAVRDSRREG